MSQPSSNFFEYAPPDFMRFANLPGKTIVATSYLCACTPAYAHVFLSLSDSLNLETKQTKLMKSGEFSSHYMIDLRYIFFYVE